MGVAQVQCYVIAVSHVRDDDLGNELATLYLLVECLNGVHAASFCRPQPLSVSLVK